MREGLELAQACAHAAADKKAENPILLDLRGISSLTDFFFICTATSEPQLKAIVSSIREQLRENCRVRPLSMDGSPSSQWVVIDYGELIVHVFLEVKREFYGLETLWRDAPRLEVL
jgi:ribosome-associated protein